MLYDDEVDDREDSANRFHSVVRGLTFFAGGLSMTLAASPNLAQLLFCDDEEDLLNVKTRTGKYKLAKYNGRPSDEYIEDMDDKDERELLRKDCDVYDELDFGFREPSSMSYCYIYYNLIVACAIHGRASPTSIHDGCGTLRGGDPRNKSAESLLASAALRRAMSLWTDKHVLSSCGDAMAPAASLAVSAVEYYDAIGIVGGVTCRKHELIPGLSFDGAVVTCMNELLEQAGSAQYSVKLLKKLGEIALKSCTEGASSLLTDLPIERRFKVLLAIVHYVMNDSGNDSKTKFGFSRGAAMPTSSVNDIFKAIYSMQNQLDLNLVASVWQKSVDDGESNGPEPAGQNGKSRSFMYYLLRNSTSRQEWGSLEVVKLIKDFSQIPTIHKAPDDAKAKEKDKCKRLAVGDKRHDEYNAMISRIYSGRRT